jgi:hypothetical protein
MVILLAGSLASLNYESGEATEPSVSNSPVVHERLLLNQEFNSLEDRKVIFVKIGGNSNTPPVNPYRTAPKLVNQRLGAERMNPAGANGGGGSGNAKFDDNCPVPKIPKKKQSKKQSDEEECELDENVKIKEIEIVDKIK